MIDWDNYFDRIYCIFFLPNKERFFRLDKEFERVGLKKCKNFAYDFVTPSSFDLQVFGEVQQKPHLRIFKPAYVNQLRNFEIIVRRAIAVNSELTLIVEDDVAFLKDLDRIDEIIRTMPKGFHAFQMEKNVPTHRQVEWDRLCKAKSINCNWVDASGVNFTAAGCNAFTREGLEELLRIISTCPGSIDQFGEKFSLPWAISRENLTMQIFYSNAVCMTYASINALHNCYQNIDYSKYACPPNYTKGIFL